MKVVMMALIVTALAGLEGCKAVGCPSCLASWRGSATKTTPANYDGEVKLEHNYWAELNTLSGSGSMTVTGDVTNVSCTTATTQRCTFRATADGKAHFKVGASGASFDFVLNFDEDG